MYSGGKNANAAEAGYLHSADLQVHITCYGYTPVNNLDVGTALSSDGFHWCIFECSNYEVKKDKRLKTDFNFSVGENKS